MPFFSPFKAKADLSVSTVSLCLPGDSLPVLLRLTPQDQIRARQIRVELVGEETYYVRQTTHGPKGQTQTHIVKKVDVFSQTELVIADQPALNPGIAQEWKATLSVSIDAPGTCKGKVVDIRWFAKGILDVPGRPDTTHEFPLAVVTPDPAVPTEPSTPEQQRFDECTLSLEATRTASAGQNIAGRLRLNTERKFQVRGIRVELLRIEEAGARGDTQIAARQDISGPVSFDPYEGPSFPFSLAMPSDAPPTSASPHSRLRWQLKVTLDRAMRSDFHVERDIFVYNAAAV